MMLISTRSIRSGMVLGSPVYNMRGKTLIHDRVPLTDRMIQRLLELNIQYVYIEDSLSHGIEVK